MFRILTTEYEYNASLPPTLWASKAKFSDAARDYIVSVAERMCGSEQIASVIHSYRTAYAGPSEETHVEHNRITVGIYSRETAPVSPIMKLGHIEVMIGLMCSEHDETAYVDLQDGRLVYSEPFEDE